jgi:hypothetical protein
MRVSLVISPVPISSLRKFVSNLLISKTPNCLILGRMAAQETLSAYLWGTEISKVAATCDFRASNITIIPDQSGLSSVALQTGQTLPVVRALHFLQATSLAIHLLPPFLPVAGVVGCCFAFFISCSIHSIDPRNG